MEQAVMQSTSSPSKLQANIDNKSLLSSSTIDRSFQKYSHTTDSCLTKSDNDHNQKNKYNEECIQQGVYGIVKWYNVKFRYGFIKRFDTQEDVFVHKNGIKRSSPNKAKSIGDGEVVQFDIYRACKGPEARNVTGPEGKPARASRYARIINRFIIPKYIQPYMKQYPSHFKNFFPKYIGNNNKKSKKNIKIKDVKSNMKNDFDHLDTNIDIAKNDNPPTNQPITNTNTTTTKSEPLMMNNIPTTKYNDKNSNASNKESGYTSKDEKTTSTTSAIEKKVKNIPSNRRRSTKKVIYIIKDQRANPKDDTYNKIQQAIQQDIATTPCNCNYIES